jgi:hypothetical protein
VACSKDTHGDIVAEALKPLQLGVAGGIVLAFFMLIMGTSGTCAGAGQGFYGMMGIRGPSLAGGLLSLACGAIIGFAGGAGIAIIYNSLIERSKESKD